jgi:hypothetical protein
MVSPSDMALSQLVYSHDVMDVASDLMQTTL